MSDQLVQLERSQKSQFPLGNWGQLQLPPVTTCKANFVIQYGQSSHSSKMSVYYKTHM